ncbi:MAG TPA: ATP-binding protein, partial [Candidatus Ozemobacteraceae bacterium]|nr:ATP-binding protein [Candidatus Ozemobacteraceae bacterium]
LREEIELRRKRELQLSISERARVAMRIAAGISHHFNNMFQTVLGYSELIEAAAKPESEIVRQVRRIVAATQKTRQVVNQLSNYLGNSNNEPSEIHLEDVFAEIEVAFAGILPGGVSLTSSIARNCPNRVFNRTDIIQALTNIVMNSIEAMPASGGQINIKASLVHGRDYARQIENVDSGADYVEIAVVDNGTGMEKAVLEKSCEPFFTTAGNFADKNGLGLSVVQGIMHASGGFLSIDSEMGSGTVVRLLFPVSGVV